MIIRHADCIKRPEAEPDRRYTLFAGFLCIVPPVFALFALSGVYQRQDCPQKICRMEVIIGVVGLDMTWHGLMDWCKTKLSTLAGCQVLRETKPEVVDRPFCVVWTSATWRCCAALDVICLRSKAGLSLGEYTAIVAAGVGATGTQPKAVQMHEMHQSTPRFCGKRNISGTGPLLWGWLEISTAASRGATWIGWYPSTVLRDSKTRSNLEHVGIKCQKNFELL